MFSDDGSGTWSWKKDYLYREASLLASHSADLGTWNYHLDHLGTVRLITRAPQYGPNEIVNWHDYYAFGEETLPKYEGETLRFTGHERDETSYPAEPGAFDLDYMLARYYSPWMGRFLAVDPSQASARPKHPQSWNRYGYALNNPLRFLDPDGRETESAEELAAQFIAYDFFQAFQDGRAAFFALGALDGAASEITGLTSEPIPFRMLSPEQLEGLPPEIRAAHGAGEFGGRVTAAATVGVGVGVPYLALEQGMFTADHAAEGFGALFKGDTRAFMTHMKKAVGPSPKLTKGAVWLITLPAILNDLVEEEKDDDDEKDEKPEPK